VPAAKFSGGASPEQTWNGLPGLGSARDWDREHARDAANPMAGSARRAEAAERARDGGGAEQSSGEQNPGGAE